MRYVKTVKCTKNRTTDKQTPQMADSSSIGATSDFASSWSSSYLNDLMSVLYNFPESIGKIKPFGCLWKYCEKRTIPWSIIISSIETAVFMRTIHMLFGQTHDVTETFQPEIGCSKCKLCRLLGHVSWTALPSIWVCPRRGINPSWADHRATMGRSWDIANVMWFCLKLGPYFQTQVGP